MPFFLVHWSRSTFASNFSRAEPSDGFTVPVYFVPEGAPDRTAAPIAARFLAFSCSSLLFLLIPSNLDSLGLVGIGFTLNLGHRFVEFFESLFG